MPRSGNYKKDVGNIKQLQHLGFGCRAPILEAGGDSGTVGTQYTNQGQELHTVAGRGGRVYGLLPVFVAWLMSSSTVISCSNDFTVKAGLYASSTNLTVLASPYTNNVPSTWNGLIEQTLQRSSDQFTSVGSLREFLFQPNQQIAVRYTFEATPAGTPNTRKLPYSVQTYRSLNFSKALYHEDTTARADSASLGSGFVHNTNSIVSTGLTNPSSVNSNAYACPALLLGHSDFIQPSVLVIGDSNAYGTGDQSGGDGQGAYGYIERAFRITDAGVTACALWVRSGATLAHYDIGSASTQLFSAGHFFTHLLNQLSGNSIGGGVSLAELKRLTINGWRKARSKNLKTIQLSSLPRTNAGNTAVAAGWEVGGVRDQYNAWCASVVGQPINEAGNIDTVNGTVWLDSYWDILSAVQNPVNNLWLSNTYSADGIHMTATAHALAALLLKVFANTLTVG